MNVSRSDEGGGSSARAGCREDRPRSGETKSALHDGGSVPGVPVAASMTVSRSDDPENSVYAFNFSIPRLFPPTPETFQPHLPVPVHRHPSVCVQSLLQLSHLATWLLPR